jgi:hypothetical protein
VALVPLIEPADWSASWDTFMLRNSMQKNLTGETFFGLFHCTDHCSKVETKIIFLGLILGMFKIFLQVLLP